MIVTVNGEERTVPDGLTVAALIEEVGLPLPTTIAEVNEKIVDRASYDTTSLEDGDVIELVRFVGGG